MNQASASGRWQAAPDLIWTHYDDSSEWVVYHPASCNAHLLTASAYLLWKLVSDGRPHALEELAAVVAAALGRPPDEELTRVIRDTLAFMDGTGLIHPVSA